MIEKEIHFMLMKCFQASNNSIVKEISKLGLLSGQPKILEYLLEHDGVKSIDIAVGCFLDKSTVAGLLSRMESMNLVKRCENPNDGRSSLIFLTEEGKEKAHEIKKICKKVDIRAMSGIKKEEEMVFLNTLKRMIENLGSYTEEE